MAGAIALHRKSKNIICLSKSSNCMDGKLFSAAKYLVCDLSDVDVSYER